MSKVTFPVIPLLFAILFGFVRFANAQNVSAYIGVGAATDSANGQLLDPIGDVGPTMGGKFATFGADIALWRNFGFGAEYSVRLDRSSYAPYAGLTYRPALYDGNAVWHPRLGNPHIAPEFQVGAGELNLRFYQADTGCAMTELCPILNDYVASSNHFQWHFSGGVRFYFWSGLFIRPQVDLHWINNLQEFGRSLIPEYSVAVGYNLKRH